LETTSALQGLLPFCLPTETFYKGVTLKSVALKGGTAVIVTAFASLFDGLFELLLIIFVALNVIELVTRATIKQDNKNPLPVFIGNIVVIFVATLVALGLKEVSAQIPKFDLVSEISVYLPHTILVYMTLGLGRSILKRLQTITPFVPEFLIDFFRIVRTILVEWHKTRAEKLEKK